jgi:cysteinyl-tRNA synthetase
MSALKGLENLVKGGNILDSDTKESFTSWYTCGPTIYSHSHLGHARTFTTVDMMIRTYRALGVPIRHLMNITDIDDKILGVLIKKNFAKWRIDTGEGRAFELMNAMLHREGYASLDEVPVSWIQDRSSVISMDAVTLEDYKAFIDQMEANFWSDMKALGNERPDRVLRVSECIDDIVEFIGDLVKNGMAYEGEGSVYLDYEAVVSRPLPFEPDVLGETREKTLVYKDVKKSPKDFALWKAAKPFELAFDSPWSKGRPGWHVECTVMTNKGFEGAPLSCHAGGIDLRFPHHSNEWLLALAGRGPKEVRASDEWCDRWAHVGHLLVPSRESSEKEDVKMSQSLGNVTTIRDFLGGGDDLHHADVLRYLWLMSDWSKPLVLSRSVLVEAKAGYNRVKSFLAEVDHLERTWESHDASHQPKDTIPLDATLAGDFIRGNFPSDKVLRQIHEAIDSIYRGDRAKNPSSFLRLGQVVSKWFNIFGFTSVTSSTKTGGLAPKLIKVLAKLREDIRGMAKSSGFRPLYSLSDKLRDVYLKDLGISLEDANGTTKTKFK